MKSGDKIVCILNIRGAYDHTPRLYVDRVYTYESCNELYSGKKYIRVKEYGYRFSFPEESFISLLEYRKRKLEKLNENRR